MNSAASETADREEETTPERKVPRGVRVDRLYLAPGIASIIAIVNFNFENPDFGSNDGYGAVDNGA